VSGNPLFFINSRLLEKEVPMKTKHMYPVVASLVIFGLVAGFPAPAGAKSKPTEIVFSTYWPTSYEYLWLPIVHLAEKVEKQSNGRVKFKLYHSAQLFKGKEEFAALERGDIDMTAPLDIYNTGIVLELGISNLPFMWGSPASLQKTLDAGLWGLGINQKLLKHNMVVLNVAAGGPYQIYAKNFPVYTPEDLKGKKWGVSGSTASKAMELLGGAPTTMSSGELYLALQRGTIDGCTRPLITGLGRKLYEVVEYLSVTNMAYFCSFLIINKKKWDTLPKDVQDIMKKAAKERSHEQLERLNAFMEKAIALYKEKGVKVHIATPEELAKFKKAMAPVYDWWLSKVPEGKKYIEFAEKHH
jgi:tripartite ATP-independent transporter DctP family solute receptor